MRKILAFAIGSTALFSVAMTGPAQAADFEPVTIYPYAATGFFAGGYAWMDREECLTRDNGPACNVDGLITDPVEWLTLNVGGDIVLPLYNNWNLQLGAAGRVDNFDLINQFTQAGPSDTVIQFQANLLGFWRDPALGVFGIEAGAFSPLGKNSTDGGPANDGSRHGQYTSLRIGGVAEYFFSDFMTFGAYGGALLPIWPDPFSNKPNGKAMDTGYYAGGHLTFYATDMLALAGYGQYTELNAHANNGFELQRTALRAGGKIRYLTSMPNVEVFASGGYIGCRETFGGPEDLDGTYDQDGVEFLAGVNIRLGGISDSLVNIDRSNAIDTRTWACANIRQ